MRRSKPTRALAAFAALTFIAAACGGSDEPASEPAAEPAAEEPAAEEPAAEEPAAEEPAAEEPAAEEPAEEEPAAEEPAEEEPAAAPAGLADNSSFGNGAEEWEAAVLAGDASPLAADGDAIDLFMVNLEGSPGGSFPEVREGLEIAIDYINNTLGGVGADLAAGTAGQPLSLDSCPHAIDPAEAQACATESVSADPAIIVKGVDFFSPLMWPLWEGQYPVIDTLPIFVADFVAPSSLAMGGACVSAFPSAIQLQVEQGHEKLVIIHSDNAPGNECFTDTQERFLQYYADTEGIEFLGIPDIPGDPSDNDANVQTAANFIGDANGAISFGLAAADCAAYNDSIDAAGLDAAVYNSGSCVDDATQSAESSIGKFFGFTGPPAPENEALLAQFPEFWQWEVNHREELLIAGEPESPRSSFMRLGFNTGVMAYQVLNSYIAGGGDPNDHTALIDFMSAVDNQHRVGGTPLDCANKVDDWGATCEFITLYFQWDGNEMVNYEPFGFEPSDLSTWTNIRDLLVAVQENVPRGG